MKQTRTKRLDPIEGRTLTSKGPALQFVRGHSSTTPPVTLGDLESHLWEAANFLRRVMHEEGWLK